MQLMKTDDLNNALVQDLSTSPPSAVAALTWLLPIAAVLMEPAFLFFTGVRVDQLFAGLKPTAIKLGLGLPLATNGLIAAIRLARSDVDIARSARLLLIGLAFAMVAVAAELVTGGQGA
jgi:hypothetical protein